MSRVRSMQYDHRDEVHWDSGQEIRKAQSAKDRCKSRKTKSIRQGIEDFWDKHQVRQNIADSFDDFDDYDDFDDLDDFHNMNH